MQKLFSTTENTQMSLFYIFPLDHWALIFCSVKHYSLISSTAYKITMFSLPFFQDQHTSKVLMREGKRKDLSLPANKLFEPFPYSRKLQTKTSRNNNSFFPTCSCSHKQGLGLLLTVIMTPTDITHTSMHILHIYIHCDCTKLYISIIIIY